VPDPEFVQRRLREIKEALRYMEDLVSMDERDFIADYRSRYALRHLILEIVEAAISLSLHILSEDFGEKAETYVDALSRMAEHGIITPRTAREIISLV